MRRSALALGASTMAVALMGADTAAADGGQQITTSIGAAQVQSVSVVAPVRVLSPGEDVAQPQTGSAGEAQQPARAPAGRVQQSDRGDARPHPAPIGPTADVKRDTTSELVRPDRRVEQHTHRSAATLQATSVTVQAPVRVLSAGDDAQDTSTPGQDRQQTDASAGAAQVGAVSVVAPVRVLSPGDAATLQAESPATPCGARSGGCSPGAGSGGSALAAAAATPAGPAGTDDRNTTAAGGRARGSGESRRPHTLWQEAARLAEAAAAPRLRVLAGLPFTGWRVLPVISVAFLALVAGAALRWVRRELAACARVR
jgi:hypothetical protein